VLVDSSEAVTRVSVTSILVALAAVVKVRAVEALVAHTMNHLVATIADGSVSKVAASGKKSLLGEGEGSTIDGRFEVMSRVMAMRVKHVAVQAEVVVITLDARDKVAVGKGHDTGIASAG
jgi:O-methyltransferase involved in polyketide biosynthesis